MSGYDIGAIVSLAVAILAAGLARYAESKIEAYERRMSAARRLFMSGAIG
jgi:hypothetical protein